MTCAGLLTRIGILVYNSHCTEVAGCGSAWLERLVWDQEVAGSNPVTPIVFFGGKPYIYRVSHYICSVKINVSILCFLFCLFLRREGCWGW